MKKKTMILNDLKVQSFKTEHKYLVGGRLKEPEYTEEGYPDCGKTGLLVDPNCQH